MVDHLLPAGVLGPKRKRPGRARLLAGAMGLETAADGGAAIPYALIMTMR